MKHHTLLSAIALVASLFTGCSKNSPAAAGPKVMDLGIVDISNGVASRHVLADGRVCDMTPTILHDGRVKLVATIDNTNAAGARVAYSLTTVLPADQATLLALDQNNVVGLTLHTPK